DSYYCQFFYQGSRRTITVGAVSETKAQARAEDVDKLLRQLKRGERHLPDSIDIVDFVLTGGDAKKVQKTAEKPAAPSAVLTLEGLRDQYLTTHQDAQEKNSLATVKMHFGHFIQTFGARLPMRQLDAAKLQEHIDRRRNGKKRLSPVTLKKEMATLR